MRHRSLERLGRCWWKPGQRQTSWPKTMHRSLEQLGQRMSQTRLLGWWRTRPSCWKRHRNLEQLGQTRSWRCWRS